MTASDLANRIDSLLSHILFRYHGEDCGIDPFNRQNIDLWYGEHWSNMKSVDEVMTTPFFDGKCLAEIADEIEIYES